MRGLGSSSWLWNEAREAVEVGRRNIQRVPSREKKGMVSSSDEEREVMTRGWKGAMLR